LYYFNFRVTKKYDLKLSVEEAMVEEALVAAEVPAVFFI
jgi:hypothetical protein